MVCGELPRGREQAIILGRAAHGEPQAVGERVARRERARDHAAGEQALGGGVTVNDRRLTAEDTALPAPIENAWYVVRLGKRRVRVGRFNG